MEKLNDPLYQCFVSPSLCLLLMEAGMTTEVPYKWKIKQGMATLITHAFDLDNYYKDGFRYTDEICPPERVLPAYQAMDMEKLLPFFELVKNYKHNYILSCMYKNIVGIKANRLPDAFALMVLALIDKDLMNVPMANEILKNCEA